MILGFAARCVTTLVAAGGALLVASAACAHSLEEVEQELWDREQYVQFVSQPAPDFTLQKPDENTVTLADYRGKVVVLWFIYTRCPDVCPLHSEAVAGLQRMINSTPMRDLVQFVSITTDPASDTAEVLNAYGEAHGLDPVNWVFLRSGDPAATRVLAEEYGLLFTETDDGMQMHRVVTHLIDKSGNLRARFHGLNFNPTNFIVYANALINDFH